jgi:ribonuclease HI
MESVVVDRRLAAAGSYCSYYQAEMVAICEALKWLVANDTWQTARIATDSLSGLQSLKRFWSRPRNELAAEAFNLLGKLCDQGKTVELVWIPSHCGLPGNDLADAAAAEATELPQDDALPLFDVAKARLWANIPKRAIQHERSRNTYGYGGVAERLEQGMPRADAVALRRFRIGHSLELNAYRQRIGLQENGDCRRCGEEPETNEHVMLRCPAAMVKRQQYGLHALAHMCSRPRETFQLLDWFRRGGGRPPDKPSLP